MNLKALDQLEQLREEGRYNMWTESAYVIRRANDLEMYDLVVYAHEKNWIDILDELSTYKEILNDFEAQRAEDEFEGV